MIVYLPKMTLWHSADITTYPRCLARGVQGNVYSFEEVLTLFGVPPGLHWTRRHALRDSYRNIWDVERRENDIILQGVCLVERNATGFQMTEHAWDLVDAYLQDKAGEKWQERLASILVDYDVRLRVILYLLGQQNYHLTITSPYRLCPQEQGEAGAYELFCRDEPNLNTLLTKWSDYLLGEALWKRIERLGLTRSPISLISGLKGGPPSLESYSFWQEMKLLQDLGVLKKNADRLTLVATQAKEVFSAESFEELVSLEPVELFLSVLQKIYHRLQDTDGFVIYSRLKEAVEQEIQERHFEEHFQHVLTAQKILIVQHTQALRNDGRGFLGNVEYQRIQLAFM